MMTNSLGEDINKLRLKRNIMKRNLMILIFNEQDILTINLNIFGALIINRISNNMKSCLALTEKRKHEMIAEHKDQ